MKIFLDSEFTGLHQNTTLISLALIDEQNKYFYVEFNDYDETQIDKWLDEHIIQNLVFNDDFVRKNDGIVEIRGDTTTITKELADWLSTYTSVEIWGDCLAYDWVLFNNLFGHAFNIPSNVYYIPFDICTVFKLKGYNPDTSRKEFTGLNETQHNALCDAKTIKKCYELLMG